MPVVLVGNKCDLEDQRAVKYGEGEELAKIWDCPFFETSAKIKLNVEGTFIFSAFIPSFLLRSSNIIHVVRCIALILISAACFFELFEEIRFEKVPQKILTDQLVLFIFMLLILY